MHACNIYMLFFKKKTPWKYNMCVCKYTRIYTQLCWYAYVLLYFMHACTIKSPHSLCLPQNCLLSPPHIQVQKLEGDTASLENAKLAKFAEEKATLEKKNQELSEELVMMGKKYNMAVRLTETAAGIYLSILFSVNLSLSFSLRSSFFFSLACARAHFSSSISFALARSLSLSHARTRSLALSLPVFFIVYL